MAETNTDISEETRRALSFDNFVKPTLDNVPGLERPMAAGPRDMLIGRDELGNAIYRTILGTTYTVRRATPKESETTRTKVENWVDEGAPLPSMEQVVDTAQAIPGAVLDSAERTLEGTATLGEAMSWAPAMGAASLPAEVPEGALRIFGGKNAAHAPIPKVNFSAVPDLDMYAPEVREAVYKLPNNSNYSDYKNYFLDKLGDPQDPNEAELLAQEAIALKGAADSIAKQNAGWSLGADGNPRFEIDDSRAVYLGQFAEVGKPTTLEAILDHGDLYYQYPELKEVEVTLKPMEGGLLGQYNPNDRTIELNSNKSPEELKSTLLHEIQHAVQQIEGFDGGSNQISASMYGPVYEANSPEAKKAWEDYTSKMSRFEAYELTDAFSELGKNTQKAVQEFRPKAPNSFFVDILGEAARDFSEKNFSPSDSYVLLARISDVIEQHPDFKDYLKNSIPEEQFEKILKLDSSGTKFSPFSRDYGYQVVGVTPPPEPYFLQPNGEVYRNAFKLYRRNMGETEARNVQTRQDMTREERLANPPRQTEDIPRGFQWANPQRFAEGGLVDQTQFAFMNEGGMIDDGSTVEPTTGNEVPPGSLKEEVADSIDAKLSVGEYVVPADVVQYFGVAHFEKLRQKAKEGLAEMEANGRIGGDPEEDELPFSDEELEAEDMEEDGAQGFAEGGLAWNSPQTTGMTNTGTETVTYVGPDGTKLPVLFMNGQPIQQIPQGYVPEGQAKQQQAAFKSIRPTSNSESGGALNTMQPKDMSEWGVEDFERYSNSQGIMDIATKLPALLGPGGMIMGGLLNKAYQMQGAKALEEIDNRLAMTDLDEQSRTRLEAVKANLSSNTEEGGGLLGGLTGSGGMLEKLFGGGVKTTSEATPEPSFGGLGSGAPQQPRTSMSGAPAGSPRPQPRPESSGMTNPAVTRTSSGNTVSRSASGTKTTSSPGGSREVKSTGESNPGGFNQSTGSWSTGKAFAEGGFVKRRNKK